MDEELAARCQVEGAREKKGRRHSPNKPFAAARGMRAAWVMLIISLSVTAWGWYATKADAVRSSQQRFDTRVAEIKSAIQQRMVAYEHTLRGGIGLFAASGSVGRGQWRAYVQSLDVEHNYPGIQGVGFSKLVPAAGKDAYVRQVRAEGFPSYSIKPEGERPLYAPVDYVEPFSGGNQQAFGYDMFSEPTRRAAMEQARDTGRAAASGKLTLIWESERSKQSSFLLYLPVYRNGWPHETVAERRAALMGYVYSPFRMGDLMRGILGRDMPDVDLEIFDGTRISEKSQLYDSDSSGHAVANKHRPVFTTTATVDIAGRTWSLHFSSLPPFESAVDAENPLIVLGTGTLISLLLFIVTWSMVANRERALVLANGMVAAFRENEEKLNGVLDSLEDAVWSVSADTLEVLYLSPAAERIYGRPVREFYDTPHLWQEMVHPDDYARAEEFFAGLLEGGVNSMEYRIVRPNGEICWLHDRARLVYDADGKPLRIDGIASDFTRRKEAEEALQRQAQVIAQIHDAVISTDLDGFVMSWNKGAERLLEYRAEDALGKHISLIQPREDQEFFRHQAIIPLKEKGSHEVEARMRRKSGEDFYAHISLSLLRDASGDPIGMIWAAVDISERKSYEAQIEHQANHDALTGLLNRNLLQDRLPQAIAHARRHGWGVSVLFLDLDHFKFVNDSLGHNIGDLLLKAVAGRLLSCVREGDTVARQGGDEFVLILVGISREEDVSAVAQKILDSLSLPFMIDGQELFVACSIGVASYPKDGEDVQTLLKHADSAMYRAKETGRNNLQFYTEEMNAKALERLALENGLRHALERGELLLHYQPQVDLYTGGVVGMEALVRWQNPELGLVSPARFIPLAEETGLIAGIGEWVLRTACVQNKVWQDAGLPAITVSVNLSVHQFRKQNMVAVVAAILEETGLDPWCLELEITESMLMKNADEAIVTLGKLKEKGVKISVDDFGTGYSSLSYLKRFPIDTLKIDRSFVQDITSDPDDAAISKAVISLAHDMGLKVIAEGVETEAQMAFLRMRHCDQMQGYYFSKPLPAEEFGQLLRERRRLRVEEESQEGVARTLLLLDDEESVLFSLTRLFQNDGYRIIRTNTAGHAFELLATYRVGVILCDQRMPSMSGVEFLRRAKQLYPETVRILLSGYTDLESVTGAINEGAVFKILTKPWEDDLLRATVRDAFENFELARENERLAREITGKSAKSPRARQERDRRA